ncbi:uncharacterized protein B0I36DRAFT_417141 [Microdochium trichocladiopsis]|uniref:Uncharacterized protein n=1 Tax=Microdochium trichocladiopsis TaxID=1682393 RepID=A0A9P8Y1I8_9PEZI|nr:uncharacterized protein B0I36DRAFT_417141 [Microdochium trichocladiopsis]KAH7025102.1 hypothetical protein B0I36DRAFT_417141 [Microdochium trichocladiopsis]
MADFRQSSMDSAPPTTGQYQGSKAFANVILQQSESINPNTGTLNFSKSLVHLRGVRDSINCLVDITYNPGALGTFGLPRGWGLKLPHVIPGASVTAGGRTYAIDLRWVDSKGYMSGLRYLNDHGVKFEVKEPPLPLPSKKDGLFTYRILHGDGSVDYFDATGLPIEHDDVFGNRIHYKYISRGGPQQALLDYIEDSWGQRIQFKYQPGSQIIVIGPDQGTTTINLAQQTGVLSIEDPVGFVTRFHYDKSPAGGNAIVKEIRYPTGLATRFFYSNMAYLDSTGVARDMPSVQRCTRVDANSNIVLTRTDYHFGTLSNGNTFTGANVGCRIGGLQDNLLDGNTFYAHYKSVVSHLSESPTDTDLLTLSNSNITSTQKDMYDPSVGRFVPQATSSTLYQEVTWNGHASQMPIQVTETDAISKFERYTFHTLSSNDKTITQTDTRFRVESAQNSELRDWKISSYTYDSEGRMTSKKIAWITPPTDVERSRKEVRTEIDYEFRDGTLTETTKDPSGAKTKSIYGVRVTSGPLISRVKAKGATESFEYDLLGRLRKHTDFLGQETNIRNPDPASPCTQSRTDHFGYTKRTTFDALGREISVMDNGDPTVDESTAAGGEPTRTLSQTRYDCLSQPKEQTDNIGLVTTFHVDALRRPLETTDPDGNVTSYEYDDAQGKVTQRINGDVRLVTFTDGMSRVKRQVQYPDSGSDDAICLEMVTHYDGSDRKILEVAAQIPLAQRLDNPASGPLKKMELVYDFDGAVTSKTETGYRADGSQDVVHRRYQLDLFGNRQTYVKTTSYAGASGLENHGPILVYDESNRFTELRNQLGNVETHEYDDDGNLILTRRFDKTRLTYEYDAAGQVASSSSPSGTTRMAYLAIGRVSLVHRDRQEKEYEYALDGTLLSISNNNSNNSNDGPNTTQKYTLDKFSRVIAETDAFHVVRETAFDEQGRVSRRSCKDEVCTSKYDVVNHTRGILTEVHWSGDKHHSRALAYDGFGRVRRETVTDHQTGTVLLDTMFVRDGKQQLTRVESQSDVSPELNFKREYTYDGIGQLKEDAVTTRSPTRSDEEATTRTKYEYDGNANIVVVNKDGEEKKMQYNEIDQRIDGTFRYDANGRLLEDGEGRIYTFDDQDRLLHVKQTNADSVVDSKFSYYPDDLLARHESPDKGVSMFWDDSKAVNGIETTYHAAQNSQDEGSADRTSLLLDSEGRLAAGYSGSGPPTYLVDQNGSTALALRDKHARATTYEAYGSAKKGSLTASSSIPAGRYPSETTLATTTTSAAVAALGFRQEYSDQATGLAYLRSRFYSTAHMSFVSMDATLTENRYAYCAGDPINLADPTGHFWSTVVRWTVGIVVAAAVTAVAGPVIGAAIGSGTAAILATAALSGAVSNLAAGAAASLVEGNGYSLGQAAVDLTVGAVTGLATQGTTLLTATALSQAGVGETVSAGASWAAGQLGGVVAGTATDSALTGRSIDWASVAASAATSLAVSRPRSGAGGLIAASRGASPRSSITAVSNGSRAAFGARMLQNATSRLPLKGSFSSSPRSSFESSVSRASTADSFSGSMGGSSPAQSNPLAFVALQARFSTFCKPDALANYRPDDRGPLGAPFFHAKDQRSLLHVLFYVPNCFEDKG